MITHTDGFFSLLHLAGEFYLWSFWQVRIGMDLTKIVLPTFILERRSLLEMFADFFAHPDLFVRYAVCSVQCRNHAARMLLTPNISICVMCLWWNQVMSWRTQSNWGHTHTSCFSLHNLGCCISMISVDLCLAPTKYEPIFSALWIVVYKFSVTDLLRTEPFHIFFEFVL